MFHHEGEEALIYDSNDAVCDRISRSSIGRSMFLAWMVYNGDNIEGRTLCTETFHRGMFWNKKARNWSMRKGNGFSIGRTMYVNPSISKKGLFKTYEDIKIVNGVLYESFQAACDALNLFDDDKEYIDAIIEASYYHDDEQRC